MAMRLMIFIADVWSGLCKLTTYQLLNALMSFGPTQRGPTLPTHIYIADMRTKEVSECTVTSERSVLVKIANSNVMPTLRGFRWYPYFGAQE